MAVLRVGLCVLGAVGVLLSSPRLRGTLPPEPAHLGSYSSSLRDPTFATHTIPVIAALPNATLGQHLQTVRGQKLAKRTGSPQALPANQSGWPLLREQEFQARQLAEVGTE